MGNRDFQRRLRLRRAARRTLRLEPLEDRLFLSATSMLPAISPTWFQDITDADTPDHVNPATLSLDAAYESAKSEASDGGDGKTYDWIVRFDGDSLGGIGSIAQTAGLLTGGGIQFEVLRGLGLVGQVLVRSSGESIAGVADWLAQNSHVASYEVDVVQKLQAVPDDPQYGQLWGLENLGQTGGTVDADIDAEAAWDVSTGSSSIVVGVIDTGVDYTHSDLAANIWTNPGEIAGNGLDDDGNGFIDDVHGYDFVNNDGDPMDDHNHGTHVAGTIAAAGNDGQGITGVNWSSSIMGLKFLSAGGSGYTSDAVRAVNYATMMRTTYGVNVRVTNNSWGGGGYSDALASAIQASGDAGILFVAAAGNDGTNNDLGPHYPSNYELPNVISVAASNHYDNLAYFSNYGAGTVDLAAPGRSIYSTVPGNGYASYSGTSMATPHVAGVAALAWSVAPEATVAEVRDAIFQGTDVLASLSGTCTTGGRLNAFNTLQLLGEADPETPVIASLQASPYTITAGTGVTLTAQGVADPDGSITAVHFYEDTNVNGTWDAADASLGVDTTLVDSQAAVSYDTTGLALGTHRFFARAVDNASNWSAARSTIVTVIPPDDHGGNAATATAANIGSTLSGTIGTGDDEDWFAFDAVADAVYCFSVELLTMEDSMLMLYDQDGSSLLEWDDDGGPGYASSLSWVATADGTFFLAVVSYPGSATGDYRLSLEQLVDDHGNDAASATAITPGSTLDGYIESAGDVDFFAFDAVAGRRYTLETTLLGLEDSTISLYDQDGSNLIGYDDDGSEQLFASRLVWAAPASGTYYAAVESWGTTETGDYRLELRQSLPVSLGSVDYHEIVVPGAYDLDLWYRLETVHDGLLSVASDFEGVSSWFEMSLYSAAFTEVDFSGGYDGVERLDWTAGAGDTYYVSIVGSVGGGTLRLANLVQQNGSTVTVHGTDGDDTFDLTAGDSHGVTVNDVAYTFSSASVTQFVFNGDGGSDAILMTGSAGDDTAVLYPTFGTLTGPQYAATVTGAAQISVLGGGGTDEVHFYDSAGDDTFVATPDYAAMYGAGFSNRAYSFASAYSYATAGGTDQASAAPSRPPEGAASVAVSLTPALAEAPTRPAAEAAEVSAPRLLYAGDLYDLTEAYRRTSAYAAANVIDSDASSDSTRTRSIDLLLETEATWLAN